MKNIRRKERYLIKEVTTLEEGNDIVEYYGIGDCRIPYTSKSRLECIAIYKGYILKSQAEKKMALVKAREDEMFGLNPTFEIVEFTK